VEKYLKLEIGHTLPHVPHPIPHCLHSHPLNLQRRSPQALVIVFIRAFFAAPISGAKFARLRCLQTALYSDFGIELTNESQITLIII
jgi:hypothetical protein